MRLVLSVVSELYQQVWARLQKIWRTGNTENKKVKNIKKARITPGECTRYIYFSMGVVRLKIDTENMIAEISLTENSLYIVKDGKITKVEAIEYGEDKIIWKNGQVLDFIRSERVRV